MLRRVGGRSPDTLPDAQVRADTVAYPTEAEMNRALPLAP